MAEEPQDVSSVIPADHLRRIAAFRLMDDEFFSETLDGKAEAVQYILNTVLERTDFTVLEARAQRTLKSAVRHSVTLDIRARDGDGRIADIEIQRSSSGTGAKRARFHSSMMDRELLEKGQDYEQIPETFVIFITENDKYHAGLPLYHIDRTIRELQHRDFCDEAHIIFMSTELLPIPGIRLAD